MPSIHDNYVIKHLFGFQPFDFANDMTALGHSFFFRFGIERQIYRALGMKEIVLWVTDY
tara:strand:- start:111 stop:287 length:177 start_codon:yes stop_codon:yes gene_type:complete